MTREEFDMIFDGFIDDIGSLLAKKEYLDEENILKHFYDGAKSLGITLEQYLFTLMTKHIISLREIVFGDNSNEDTFKHLKDIVIYCLLLDALYIEKERDKTI